LDEDGESQRVAHYQATGGGNEISPKERFWHTNDVLGEILEFVQDDMTADGQTVERNREQWMAARKHNYELQRQFEQTFVDELSRLVNTDKLDQAAAYME
jgi:hypothetical protein